MTAVRSIELAEHWAYRATIERDASLRFARLADRLASAGCHRALCAIATEAAAQERAHVVLCAELAARFGGGWTSPDATVPEVAPTSWSAHDRALYEVVAFCCVTETANTALVATGLDHIDDRAVARAARQILADEVQHARLGWQFLAHHPLDGAQAARLGVHLPTMIGGAIRLEQWRTPPPVRDPALLARHGAAPVAERRAAFVGVMRAVLLPGLTAVGVDVSDGARYLDQLETLAA